jgi:hypothetical protein
LAVEHVELVGESIGNIHSATRVGIHSSGMLEERLTVVLTQSAERRFNASTPRRDGKSAVVLTRRRRGKHRHEDQSYRRLPPPP